MSSGRGPEARHVPEARVGHVLPVEAGDGGRHGDDRGPARHLLHDRVEPVALDRQVRLEDRGDQVAQRLGPLGRAQHVVVDVLVVRHHRVVHDVQVAPHQRVDDLAHRHDDPAQQDQALAQLERAPLHLPAARPVVEEHVLEALDLVVEGLDGARSACRRSTSSRPYSRNSTPCFARSGESSQRDDHVVDVEVRGLADGDQRLPGDERRDLGGRRAGRWPGRGAPRSR